MARLSRVSPIGVAQHVMQRGNSREICFVNEEDMKAYLNWLKVFSKKYRIDVHAWVLMTNHVHILCTPNEEGAISKMMQSIGRMYVRYFNFTYQRSGTLWEGRYKFYSDPDYINFTLTPIICEINIFNMGYKVFFKTKSVVLQY